MKKNIETNQEITYIVTNKCCRGQISLVIKYKKYYFNWGNDWKQWERIKWEMFSTYYQEKSINLLKAMSSEKEKGPYLTCLYRQSVAQHNESCAVFWKTDFVSCFSCHSHSDLGNVFLLVMYIDTG